MLQLRYEMRICYFIPKLEPSDTGVFVGGSVNALLSLLVGVGRQVSGVLLTSVRKARAQLVKKHGPRVEELVILTNDHPPQSLLFGFLFLLKACIWAIRNRGRAFEVAHGHSGYAIYAWATLLIGAALGSRKVHTVYCPLNMHGTVVNRKSVFLGARFAAIALKRMDHIIAISTNVRESLITAGIPASSITAIPNAIDTDRYRPRGDSSNVRRTLGVGKDDPVVLFVGNLTRSKGLDLLIAAMRRVVEDVGNARLVVTLELRHHSFDESERALAKQIVDANMQGNMIQLGIIDFMPELLAAVDIVVSPYRDTQGPSDYPLALMEAMAAGRCVVGSKTGGLPELIEDGVNGKLVEPEESEALAKALLQLVHSAELRARLGAEARRSVLERFATDRIAERHLQVYKNVRARFTNRNP